MFHGALIHFILTVCLCTFPLFCPLFRSLMLTPMHLCMIRTAGSSSTRHVSLISRVVSFNCMQLDVTISMKQRKATEGSQIQTVLCSADY